jgi:hypothetical protein
LSVQAADTTWKLTHADVAELNRSAAAGLVSMIDPKSGLCCHRVVKTAGGLIREGVSPRYTAMVLLGLHRWQLSGGPSSISVPSITKSLVSERSWRDNAGDKGLMLWLAAAVAPKIVNDLYQVDCFGQQLDAMNVPTMEAAWLLTGISYAAPHLTRDLLKSAKTLAGLTYRMLVKRQGASGFFGHQAAGKSLSSKIRGSIGSFADQVYPIYALTQYATTFGVQDALEQPRRCAQAICQAQGPLGQWWWHYNAASGKVFQRYPVYSVHQDGMAPMSLWALGLATGRDYSVPIYKGLSWIYGNNELDCDMRDKALGVIWRSVYSRGLQRRTREVLDLLRVPYSSTGDLKVLHECRPYHLGWLLYAFAEREAREPRSTSQV